MVRDKLIYHTYWAAFFEDDILPFFYDLYVSSVFSLFPCSLKSWPSLYLFMVTLPLIFYSPFPYSEHLLFSFSFYLLRYRIFSSLLSNSRSNTVLKPFLPPPPELSPSLIFILSLSFLLFFPYLIILSSPLLFCSIYPYSFPLFSSSLLPASYTLIHFHFLFFLSLGLSRNFAEAKNHHF